MRLLSQVLGNVTLTDFEVNSNERPGDRVRTPSEAELGELRDAASALASDLIKVDSSNPPGNETAVAAVLRRYLEARGVDCELVAREPDRANLIARLPGSGDGPSLALLGHSDVVPADPRGWRHPPFSGHLDEDGYLWGRGAVDMKNEVATRAVALGALASSGFKPRGDLTLIVAADEEVGTADVGLSWLVRERPDIRTDFALNEGSAERLTLSSGATIVTVAVGEKAAGCVRLTALGEAAATFWPGLGANAVPRLATLIRRLGPGVLRRRLLPSTRPLLAELAHQTDEDLSAAVARAGQLHPAFESMLSPMFADTVALTRLGGSDSLNVMPARAWVEGDCRVLPGTTEDEVLASLSSLLGDDLPYEIEMTQPLTGGSVSAVDSPLFEACRRFVARHDPGTTVVPVLCPSFTDSHYLREAFGTVAYGFWPVRSTPYEVMYGGLHGQDERVHVDDLGYATLFHIETCLAIGERNA
jgi:acetylornithine deacetylase/succinyl-diaminopimelate desuccinylase-like protein